MDGWILNEVAPGTIVQAPVIQPVANALALTWNAPIYNPSGGTLTYILTRQPPFPGGDVTGNPYALMSKFPPGATMMRMSPTA